MNFAGWRRKSPSIQYPCRGRLSGTRSFHIAALADADALRPPSRSNRDEPGNLAPSHSLAWPGRSGPLLRVLTRVQEELGRRRAVRSELKAITRSMCARLATIASSSAPASASTSTTTSALVPRVRAAAKAAAALSIILIAGSLTKSRLPRHG
jgi:hypothetical protein